MNNTILIKSVYKIEPVKATTGSVGYDLYYYNSNHGKSIEIAPWSNALIPTGVYLEIPKGYYAQVCSRSGLALKERIIVLNSPGIIDSDYRGEIGIILMNMNNYAYTVHTDDKIAQLIFSKHEDVEFCTEEHLSETARGNNGFGSTHNV